MSSKYGENSQPDATSNAYRDGYERIYGKKCSYCKGTKIDPDNVTSAPLPCPACKPESK